MLQQWSPPALKDTHYEISFSEYVNICSETLTIIRSLKLCIQANPDVMRAMHISVLCLTYVFISPVAIAF